jgi:hypothetical protein
MGKRGQSQTQQLNGEAGAEKRAARDAGVQHPEGGQNQPPTRQKKKKSRRFHRKNRARPNSGRAAVRSK